MARGKPGPTDSGRLVLTGAAGRLGRVLRPRLLARYGSLVSSDIADVGLLGENERFEPCDLANRDAVFRLMEGASAIVHFGGISNEAAFSALLPANIEGTYNVFEAARHHGVGRVVFASSNHATGFYSPDTRLDPATPVRPDTIYGVTKVFGEALGRLYHDKYGLGVACLRIGSALERPTAARHLATWLSHDDLERLVTGCLEAPELGFEVLYGVSANTRTWWRNPADAFYAPRDNAEDFVAEFDVADLNRESFQGGGACTRHAKTKAGDQPGQDEVKR
ncbi:NAD-dependent epimerase/dehydratase family protein [Pelagibacterium montanilacus]|uniref:NAD-dependent epimerase/dehydratase family protein n=1 Tax=Pelagibacterium montanilacus TaxID=2185280 RepID=UPI000F8ECC1E|nr:NAD(P)-dependent oxidoreductase [Pelagibacterium montanilacus]